RRYKKAVPLTAPAAEFGFLLTRAAETRAQYLQRIIAPQTARELVSDTYQFEGYNRIFWAGLRITGAAEPQTDADFQETLRQAVKAMRQELFEGTDWQSGAMQEHPLEEVREWGSILFA